MPEEIRLSSQEISKLENTSDFEKFWFKWEITKDEIKLLSSQKRQELKALLNTNKALEKLINDVGTTQDPSPEAVPATAQPGQIESAPVGQAPQQPEWQPEKSPEEAEKEGQQGYKIEKDLRNKWFSDLFIMARMLELGYVPTVHDKKLFGEKFAMNNKWKWVKYHWSYAINWWFLTNWNWNEKLSAANRWAADGIKNVTLSDIALEKAEIKEIVSRANSRLKPLDQANLNRHFSILERLETAINAWNNAEIRNLFKEYKTNFWEDARNSFKGFTDKYKINLISSWVKNHEAILNWQKTALEAELRADNQRISQIKSNNSMSNLELNAKKLKAWDKLKLFTWDPKHYLEVEIVWVSRNGQNIAVNFTQHMDWHIWKAWSNKLMKFTADSVSIAGFPEMPKYEHLSTFEFQESKALAIKNNKFKEKVADLENIKAELNKNPPELKKAAELRKNFEAKLPF